MVPVAKLSKLSQGEYSGHILVQLVEFGMVLCLHRSSLEECFAHMNYLKLTKQLISFRPWPPYSYVLDNFIKCSPAYSSKREAFNYS